MRAFGWIGCVVVLGVAGLLAVSWCLGASSRFDLMRTRDPDEMVSTDPSETRTKESNMYASIRVANP